jgi:glycerol-3-phosphate O-acyltransferase
VVVVWAFRGARSIIRKRLSRAAIRVVHRFHLRLNRHALAGKESVHDQLINDPIINDAITEHCIASSVSEAEARRSVEEYVNEIVPVFNVLSYYKFGYNVARLFVKILFRVSSAYQDHEALNAIPRDDVVLYLMNHRSNADYIVVTYVLAHGVSISYAVGEWARVWPLERVFKSFGAYFVRRGYREPLYHTVLERYVQLITQHGVTQGIFIEGGLTRTGKLRPAKVGLLDYCLCTICDPAFQRDIWLVPVAINYDRVLEDRTLIRERTDERERPGRFRQLSTVSHYVFFNVIRFLTGNLKRYGRAAVNFGTPISVREWAKTNPGVLEQKREERTPKLVILADAVLGRMADIMPVTPVPLVAAALLSFEETFVRRTDLLGRLDEYCEHLVATNRSLSPHDSDSEGILDRAWRMLTMRRLAMQEGDAIVVLPKQRPLLEFYANSVSHLLPVHERLSPMSPALDPDESLPRL